MSAEPPLLYLPLTAPIAKRDGFISEPWAMYFQLLTGAVPADGAATNGVPSGITQLTGPVTAGPGTGSQPTTITDNAITYAKIQDVSAASRVLGRGSAAGAGDTQELTLGTNLSISGTTINAASSGGTVTTTGSPASGDLAKFSGSTSITNWSAAATSVVGRSANSAGTPADIASSVENHVLVRRSSVLGFTLEQSIGYWSPLTNGDPVSPELIFDSFGDTIAVWTAL